MKVLKHTLKQSEIICQAFNKTNLTDLKILLLFFILITRISEVKSQQINLDNYNITWNTQSKNSSESMPCGGGDIGLNVWVEKGELLFYMSRSGTFDENNAFLKLGRVRVKLTPNPFESKEFSQKLILNDGYVKITGGKEIKAEIKIWVDVFKPVIYLDIQTNKPVSSEVAYENWRFRDLPLRGSESFATSYKWAPFEGVKTFKDSVAFKDNSVLFFHRNKPETIFDVTVHQQGMDSVKSLMFNALKNLAFGGILTGKNMKPDGTLTGNYLDTKFKAWKIKSISPSRNHEVSVILQTNQSESIEDWKNKLNETICSVKKADRKVAYANTLNWWNNFWKRSFIIMDKENKDISSESWQVGRNYQLFRYMLACNAFGSYPTKFNGGLFTYDPCFTDTTRCYTPDFRNWGGGIFTAQNQRLVYFSLLKSGDYDLMKPQFDFYLRILKNAELRSKVYWNHSGACFTEQIENFGLPNCAEYGWKRPDYFDKGLEYNAWLEYQWDTALEFCFMMLEKYYYTGKDISEYIPFIESCLTFFDEHYQYIAKQRGRKTFDEKGHLIIYPGSACETYKMAYNASPTIAGLKTVLEKLLLLPSEYLSTEKKEKYSEMLNRIPPVEFREIDGHAMISPAKLWERVNNTETPQLYPVFPWGIYGIGKPGLDTAINTYMYDPDALKFRSHTGWKQDNIFAARLGLTEEAKRLTLLKLKDSGRRFPAFWGPGFDWTPDHNWGGSGMIGLQEMLLQTAGYKIYLFPTWPREWDVHFKLHAQGNTIVEAEIKKGVIKVISVTPESRMKDIVYF